MNEATIRLKAEKRIAKLKLDELATYLLKGIPVADIADLMGVSKSTIYRRQNIIETEFPELLLSPEK